MGKKPFFAQTANCDPLQHKAKYFVDLAEAKEFVAAHGGGTVKKRTKTTWRLVYETGRDVESLSDDSDDEEALEEALEELRRGMPVEFWKNT